MTRGGRAGEFNDETMTIQIMFISRPIPNADHVDVQLDLGGGGVFDLLRCVYGLI